jgi:hypothetical protein
MSSYEYPDDLRITVAPEHTLDEIVEVILDHEPRRSGLADLFALHTTSFGLSYDDARLAMDRLAAGRARTATGQKGNAPNPSRDSVTYISYLRAMGTPAAHKKPLVSSVWERLIRAVRAGRPDDALDFARTDEFTASAELHEQQASILCLRAVAADSPGAQSATSCEAALRLLELAGALADAQSDRGALQRVLLQGGTAISELGEARTSQRGPEGHAWERTPA